MHNTHPQACMLMLVCTHAHMHMLRGRQLRKVLYEISNLQHFKQDLWQYFNGTQKYINVV